MYLKIPVEAGPHLSGNPTYAIYFLGPINVETSNSDLVFA
jgi:hypothetical protein